MSAADRLTIQNKDHDCASSSKSPGHHGQVQRAAAGDAQFAVHEGAAPALAVAPAGGEGGAGGYVQQVAALARQQFDDYR